MNQQTDFFDSLGLTPTTEVSSVYSGQTDSSRDVSPEESESDQVCLDFHPKSEIQEAMSRLRPGANLRIGESA